MHKHVYFGVRQLDTLGQHPSPQVEAALLATARAAGLPVGLIHPRPGSYLAQLLAPFHHRLTLSTEAGRGAEAAPLRALVGQMLRCENVAMVVVAHLHVSGAAEEAEPHPSRTPLLRSLPASRFLTEALIHDRVTFVWDDAAGAIGSAIAA